MFIFFIYDFEMDDEIRNVLKATILKKLKRGDRWE